MNDAAGETRPAPSFSLGFLTGLGGQAGTLLLSFPASVLLARALGPAIKGSVDLALLVPALVVLLVNCGVGSAATYLVGSRRFPEDDIIGTLVSFWLILSLTVLPAYSILTLLGGSTIVAPQVPMSLLLTAGLIIPAGLAQNYFGFVMLGRQRFAVYSGLPMMTAGTNLVGVVGFVLVLGLSGFGGVLASLCAQSATVVALLVILRRHWHGRLRWSPPVLRAALAYGLTGQAGNLLQFFNYRLDVIILGHLRPLADVGLYSLAVSLAEFLWYIPNASALVIFPKTAASVDEARVLTPVVFRVTGAVTLAGAIVMTLLGGPLISLAYGPAFRGSIAPLLWLLPGIVCLGGAKVLAADLNGRGLPRYNAIAALISLVVTVILDLTLIPARGAVGAALASSFAYLTTFLFTLVVYCRITTRRIRDLVSPEGADWRALGEMASRLVRSGRP